MKYYISIILSAFCSLFIFSQNDYDRNYKNKYIIIEGCDDSTDMKICFNDRLSDYVASNINKEDLVFLNQVKKKDTIQITYSLYFDKKGSIDKKDSKIGFYHEKDFKKFEYLVKNFPKVKPILDEENRGVNTQKSDVLGFVLNNGTLNPIYNYVPNEVPFSIIENVPIYKGCGNKNLGNEGLRKCMSKKIQTHVSKNFNVRKAARGLPSGTVKIYAFFKVDKSGNVTGIKIKAPTKKTEKETKRVLNLIPKLEKPGYQKGKPVIVPYSLPIIFGIK